MNKIDADLYWLFGIIGVFVLFLLLFVLVVFLNDFSQELRYINNEIKQSCGAERNYWKQQRRRLWLSLIPFVRY